MKIKNIIVLIVIFLSLIQCNKKETKMSYSNENVSFDNALAAMYFHIVFREAENAWAIVDTTDYKPDTYIDPASTETAYKKITYTESTKEVTIEYHEWETNDYLLAGTITVELSDKKLYRKDGKVAFVNLTDFSINGQSVVGESSLKYKKEKDNDNDIYTYSLLNGSAIYEEGYSMPVMISGSISNARYERIEGGETLPLDDDFWTYSGIMKGMLRDTPSLKFTNTVSTTFNYYDINNTRRPGTLYYSMNCKIPRQGASQIEISERPNIIIFYDCSGIHFDSTTEIQ